MLKNNIYIYIYIVIDRYIYDMNLFVEYKNGAKKILQKIWTNEEGNCAQIQSNLSKVISFQLESFYYTDLIGLWLS